MKKAIIVVTFLISISSLAGVRVNCRERVQESFDRETLSLKVQDELDRALNACVKLPHVSSYSCVKELSLGFSKITESLVRGCYNILNPDAMSCVKDLLAKYKPAEEKIQEMKHCGDVYPGAYR